MSTAAAVAIQTNPFPGLRPFREEEEYLFFGRESQVDAMVDKLAATHFLAVVGTSGSGKSSLVNCGLRPALHGGLMARAGTAWRMVQFRPGSDPLGAMAHALAEDGVLFRDYQAGGLTLAEIVDTTLRMSKLGLIDIYEQAHLGEDVNLLVVVDQFEELFRYRQLRGGEQENVYGVSEEAIAFVNLLLEAKEQTTYPIYVVLTMRSDFLGDCAQFPGLAEAINAGQYLVPRMTRDERRAAISGPVGVGGAEIAPVLLTRLVNDVGDNPDQLSILQHALNRTWTRWQHEDGGDGHLDLAHYQAIGTMAHALDQHAEKAYAELGTARQRQICKKLFKTLTDKATDPRGVRRPTTLGTLCAMADATQAQVTEVIDVFRQPSRSFLMPPAGDTLEPETVIDISHESLMRVWERLKTWTDKEAQSAQFYRRLADTARLHSAGKANLWRGADLQLALDWREKEKPTAAWAALYQGGFETATCFLRDSEAQIAEEKKVRGRIQTTVLFVLFLFFSVFVLQEVFIGKRPDRGTVLLSTLYKEFQKEPPESRDQNKIDEAIKNLGSLDTGDSDDHDGFYVISEMYADLSLIVSELSNREELGARDRLLAQIYLALEDSELDNEAKQEKAGETLEQLENNPHAKVAQFAIENAWRAEGNALLQLATIILVIAIWPIWLTWRVVRQSIRNWLRRQPRRKVKIKAKPHPVRRALAGLIDVCIAVVFGMFVGILCGQIAGVIGLLVVGEITDEDWTRNTLVFIFAYSCVSSAYLLFRDAIRYTYHRSIGKIALQLRPAMMTAEAGGVTMKVSARRNWVLTLALLMIVPDVFYEALPPVHSLHEWRALFSILAGAGALILVALFLEEFTLSAFKDGRTLLDRLSKTTVIDIRSEENMDVPA